MSFKNSRDIQRRTCRDRYQLFILLGKGSIMQRYFKGIQPHINIDKIESEIAFLPGPPERALEIVKNFSSYEK
jgi:hypothetical protein